MRPMNIDEAGVAITMAFRALRKRGWRARRNFACCSSCGHAELGQAPGPYVFYNRQSHAATFGNRRVAALTPDRPLYLQWHADSTHSAADVVDALTDRGLLVTWSGTETGAIGITGGFIKEDR